MNVKTPHLIRALLLALFTVLITACSGGGSSAPTTGTLSGTVTDASLTTTTAIVGASVTVFDGSTNDVIATLSTDPAGKYSVSTLTAGTYYVKVAKQGFDPVPPASLEAVPFSITAGQTTTNNIQMFPTTNVNTGWITGKVSVGTSGKGGVLVVATNGTTAYSALSSSNGTYAIYNVPAATYSVTSHIAGYTSTTKSSIVVTQGLEKSGVNLALTGDAMGQVPVSFNLIAQTGVTAPSTMVVSLLHPLTRENIPGLVQSKPHSSSISFTLSGVADGSYLVRATYANDTIVVDPDSIRKFGEPSVTVTGGAATPVDIKATGAVALVSPSNPLTSTVPEVVTVGTTPTLTWNAYPTTSDYVVEVMDATTGQVIWGGFSGSGDTMTKVVSTTSTSIVYAGPALSTGHVYRWRIYASKNDNTVLGWHLISASEDQRGLIKVQ